jgi:hypothetical protein
MVPIQAGKIYADLHAILSLLRCSTRARTVSYIFSGSQKSCVSGLLYCAPIQVWQPNQGKIRNALRRHIHPAQHCCWLCRFYTSTAPSGVLQAKLLKYVIVKSELPHWSPFVTGTPGAGLQRVQSGTWFVTQFTIAM